MLFNNNTISISFSVNQFQCNNVEIWEDEDGREEQVLVEMESTFSTEFIRCPYCGGEVNGNGKDIALLKDMPIWSGIKQEVKVEYHRYRCKKCKRVFSEDIELKHPGVRTTERAAQWVKGFLRQGLTVKAVSEITGLHWNTVRKLHEEVIQDKLEEHEKHLKDIGYKPVLLAVDEFAIHKGHTYATSVLDLQTGDVLWVGKGRTIADFQRFFEDIDPDYLSDVEAVAMDMNASYNKVVRDNLPKATIVYDRYHMQAQYGKDVLGAVRLYEARQHQKEAKEILGDITPETTSVEKAAKKAEAKAQSKEYSKLKKARWLLLKNSSNLTETARNSLNDILASHEDISVCYAMKEEMCDLFNLREPKVAKERWEKWFKAAEESNIPPLMKFAKKKEERIDGLVSHATYSISTGKLEGLNNKIKVAKRIGYGYRNDDYFFSLIRYLSIPAL